MRFHPTAVAAVCLALGAANAQVPDAGRLLQESTPPPAMPRPATPLNLQMVPPSGTSTQAGGAAVTLASLRIEGLNAVDTAAILPGLPEVAGRTFDLAGLRELALQVEQRVRARGYPFARAYVPPQDMAGGVLRIAVVEGRYGQVQAQGTSAAQAQPWLAPLRPGDPIMATPLERSLLLLNDLPGVQAHSVLRPGSVAGTGDLEVQVQAGRRWAGEVGVDNHGNRYAGRERVNAAVDVHSPFTFGDHFAARGSYTVEGTWLGSAVYSLPVGTSGWRAQLGLARTEYELGKEFAALDAHGTADVASAALTYPIVRTRNQNLRATIGWQHKRLRDSRDAVGFDERKRLNLLPLVLSGDHRGDASVSWGSLALAPGRLELDLAARAADEASARSEGHFTKVTADAAHLRSLGGAFSLFGRLSAQWASRNLDSSEKFVLGGAYGVRAWPSGEGSGDTGWLAQAEVRYRTGSFEPYVFVDGGSVRINRHPWAAGDSRRNIEGAGLGVRWADGPWSADLAVAWRAGDEPSRAEQNADRVRAWLTTSHRF